LCRDHPVSYIPSRITCSLPTSYQTVHPLWSGMRPLSWYLDFVASTQSVWVTWPSLACYIWTCPIYSCFNASFVSFWRVIIWSLMYSQFLMSLVQCTLFFRQKCLMLPLELQAHLTMLART
jgi:hypothetical protein